jgi:hypothetical protein
LAVSKARDAGRERARASAADVFLPSSDQLGPQVKALNGIAKSYRKLTEAGGTSVAAVAAVCPDAGALLPHH